MLSVGSNLLSSEETLKKVKVEYLYHTLINPKPHISSMIEQLRIVRELDSKQYALLKRRLPYVVCAMFNPAYRRTENFAYTEYFIIDIDHIEEKGLNLAEVRVNIQRDERVLMCFLSPGEDGLKILFRLKERCYDAGVYSLFYKTFAKDFSVRYNLEQVVDSKTSDVCRACFISIDANAYYNPSAESVDLNAFLPVNNAEAMFDLHHTFQKEEKDAKQNAEDKSEHKEPDSETMARIKALLNPKQAAKEKAEPYVPERLEAILGDLKTYVEETGVVLYDVQSIQYGKKLFFKTENKLAEINLFYGKRGFSVVQTPRCGTSIELNDLMAQLIMHFVDSLI
ncbi:MAG: virulence protein E [Bacteroidaceae bacterium]|nr:virulence protein E [Bacteroidaceae bacterium]